MSKRKAPTSAGASDDPCVSTFSLQGITQPGCSSYPAADPKSARHAAPLPPAATSASTSDGFQFKKLRVASVEKQLPWLPFTLPARKRKGRGSDAHGGAWRVMQDAVSGRAFWHNDGTQESRWTRGGAPPAAFDGQAALAQAGHSSDQVPAGAAGSSARARNDGRQAEGADGGGGEGSADGEGDSGDDVTEEFFCDACDKTVPLRALSGPADGHSGLCTRYECAICPDEFLLCGKCYVTLKACDRGHALYRSTARKHITRILDEDARARDAE